MKKTLLLFALFVSLLLNAQNDSIFVTESVTKNPYNVIDSLMSQLDLGGITTGIMLNRAMPTIDVKKFTGQTSTDTLQSEHNWNAIYGTLKRAALNANAGPPSTANWYDQQQDLLATGTIPFRSLHYNYHAALADSSELYSLVYWDGSYLQDVPNRTQSPWAEHTAFAAGPAQGILKDTLTASFIVKPDFIFSNSGKTVQSVQIDFGNGSGWQNIILNEGFNITWPDTGSYTIAWKTTYTDTSEYVSYSRFTLKTTKTTVTAAFWGYNGLADDEFYLTSGKSQNLGARLQIEYGCGNRSITKPFIYVEGFNPSEFYPDEPRALTYENNLFPSLFNHWQNYPVINSNHTDILHGLQEGGYDIVYVDFDQGAGDMIENAYVLEEVLRWVNQKKAESGSSTPNVVWGESMGGVIARIALRQMELANENHECDYYVSFDSPHLGANVPYGFQVF